MLTTRPIARKIVCRRGFTLVESLIASVVLALSVTAIASLLMAATSNTQAMQSRAVMIDSARHSMDSLSSYTYDVVRTGGTSMTSTSMDITTRLPTTAPAVTVAEITGSTVADTTAPITRRATLQYIDRSGGTPDRTMAVITTTATDSRGNPVTFTRLITNAQVDHP